jgi:hypothetical protein
MMGERAMGESILREFGIADVATALSAWVLDEGPAIRDEADLGLTGLGLRARVLGGAACSSGAGEAPP